MDKTTEAQATKESIEKISFIKLRLLCIKGHSQRMKRKSLEWGKIVVSHMSDKGLIFKII